MSLAARAVVVAAVVLVTTAGCDSVFRFDEPSVVADAGNDDGGAPPDAAKDVGPRPPCTADVACGGLRCKVSTGACVACLGDTDCSATRPRCDTKAGVCVECNDNDAFQCGFDRRCDLETKRCLDGCNDSDDCHVSGFTCGQTSQSPRLCIECTSPENCMPNVCDLKIGRCVECTSNALCPSSKPICDRRTGKCEGCVRSAECGSGAVCDPVLLTCRALP